MRRAQFVESGGFDAAFNPVQFEDFDLCYRLREKGWQCWYLPAIEMYHVESVTTAGTAGLANTRNVIRNGMLFKQRWRHLFEQEDGPADADTRWRPIPPTDLAAIREMPLVD
jgi:GT2 family glycosyltransferase